MLYPLSYEGNTAPPYPRRGPPASWAHNGGMTVYIDPPRWPAHGTVFSHMVSDTSLDELHETARALGISVRAFDEDHYDVPAHRHADAVALGVRAVDGKQLTRLLIRSGLRIPARRRPAKIAATLSDRWRRHFPVHPALGEALVSRWGEPHRHYHGTSHLLQALEAVDRLTGGSPSDELLLAVWFHDAVYRGVPGRDEEESAELARRELTGDGWEPGLGERVAELVLVTLAHRPDPADRSSCLLVDADLSILGGSPTEYDRYAAAVRREYEHVPDPEFRAARAEVLRTLMATPSLFHDPLAVQLWEARARENVTREIEQLSAA